MKSLSIVLVFTGYTLIYAATARQGFFATDPWNALLFDAYTGTAAAGNVATPAQVRRRQLNTPQTAPPSAMPGTA
jgi:hypothetical protein